MCQRRQFKPSVNAGDKLDEIPLAGPSILRSSR